MTEADKIWLTIKQNNNYEISSGYNGKTIKRNNRGQESV